MPAKGKVIMGTNGREAEDRLGTFIPIRNGIGVGHKGVMLLSAGGTFFYRLTMGYGVLALFL